MKVFAIFMLAPMLACAGDSAQGEIDWLIGCWISEDKSSQEVWVADSETSLVGFGVALNQNAVVFYEVLTIRQHESGSWTYTAHPSGQESASFRAVEMREQSILFFNPDHDYPQEISYRRVDNKLHARTSLKGGDKANTFDKIACN